MWRLKSCPKCRGDMFIDKDRNSWYEECLQCGFSRQLADMVVVKAQTADAEVKSALRSK
jgi:hypothetical protein